MNTDNYYRQIVHKSPFGYAFYEIILDSQGKPCDYRFLDTNASFEKLTGLAKEHLPGRTAREVQPQIFQDETDWAGIFGKIALEGGELEMEHYDHSHTRWYRVQVFSMEKMFFTTLLFDISEQKKAGRNQGNEQQAIRHYPGSSETFMASGEGPFSTIFHACPAPMALTRLSDNQLIEVNAAWEKTSGYTRQEAIGNSPGVLNLWFNPQQRDNMIEILSGNRKASQEIQIRCKSGEIRDLLMSAEKIELAGETYLLSMAQDITERRVAEKALLMSEKQAHALIAAIPDLIFRIKSDGVFLDYKAAKEDLYLAPELFIGKNILDVMPAWLAEQALDNMSKTISSGEIIIFEYSLSIRGNQDNQYECRMVPYSENQVLAIVRNISERKEFERRLKESEVNARAIMESTNDVIILLDKNGIVVDCNEAHAKRLNVKREELIGQNVFDFLPAEIGLKRKKLIETVIQTGKTGFYEDFRGGYWNEVNAHPVFNASGQVEKVAIFARDVTRRKQAEEALKISEDRLSKALQAANDGLWDWNLKTGYDYFNPRYYTMAGYEPDEFPHHVDEFVKRVHPDDLPGLVIESEAHLKGNSDHFEKEFRFRKKDGEYLWIQGIGRIVERDETGAPLRFSGTHRDIHELKQIKLIDECRLRLLLFSENHTLPELLEETLNEAEILTGSRIGFYHFIKTDQENILLQNWSTNTKKIFCKATGFDTEYHLSQAGVWADCLRDKKPVVHNDYASLTHRKGLPDGHAEVIRELVVPVIRGERISAILGVGNKPSDYNQQDVYIITKLADLAWDIAERKLIAEALSKSEAFLKELNATKDKFFSIIAHDLKNPFNTILGLSEILRDEVKDLDAGTIAKYADVINTSATHTFELLVNLLDWSRMQQGKIPFEPKAIFINQLVSNEIEGLSANAHQKEIRLTAKLPVNIILTIDENMIRTVLRNLISNAIKFTSKHGMVEVSALEQEGQVIITVSDSGVGMKAETIEKLFKIETSFTTRGTENEKGTGLGLLLCKEFIDKHGGSIRVESEEGKGCAFSVAIPKI